jgi:murein L,D-transpeptidase YcbB/YkuD
MSNRIRLFMRQGSFICIITLAFSLLTSAVWADVSADPIPSNNFAGKNYTRLKEMLPYYQEAVDHPDKYPWPVLPTGTILHPGSRDGMVILLRQRLRTTHDLAPESSNSSYYDKELLTAVKTFQWRHGLTPDGVVGDNTIIALNISAAARLKQLQLNMQRWAQLSADTEDRYVLVNVPEYQLHVIDNNEDVLTIKIVVGRPSRPTPELTSRITRMVFNPHWSVPHLLAQNDIVPKVIANSDYLNENKIRVFNNQEDGAYEMSASDVDWQGAADNGFQYFLRQDPGVKNALGLVKFEFQNSHDVYLHDTPAKALFSQDKRDFSSGCIRLEKPFALVAYLTQNDERINSEKIGKILEKKHTSYFSINSPIPIIITYITAWVDEGGAVHFASDIYNKDMEPELMTPQDDMPDKHG